MSGLIERDNFVKLKSEPSEETDEYGISKTNETLSQNKSYGDFEEISDDESTATVDNIHDWNKQSCPMWKPKTNTEDPVRQSCDRDNPSPLDLRVKKDGVKSSSPKVQNNKPIISQQNSTAEPFASVPGNHIGIHNFKSIYRPALPPHPAFFRNVIPVDTKSNRCKADKEVDFNSLLPRGFLPPNIFNAYPSPASSPSFQVAISSNVQCTNQLSTCPPPSPLNIFNSMYTPPPTPSPKLEKLFSQRDCSIDNNCHAFTNGTRKQTLITASRKIASLEIDQQTFHEGTKRAKPIVTENSTPFATKGKNSSQKFVRPWESPLRPNDAQGDRYCASKCNRVRTVSQTQDSMIRQKPHFANLLHRSYSYKRNNQESKVFCKPQTQYNGVLPKQFMNLSKGNTNCSIVSPLPPPLLQSTAMTSTQLCLSSQLPKTQLPNRTPKSKPKEFVPIANARGIKNMLDSVVMANEAIQKIMSTSTTDSLISPGYPPKPRAVRSLKPLASELLGRWYQLNADYPYPTKADVEELARLSGITEIQVKKWMANKRMRTGNTKPAMRSRGASVSARSRAALAATRLRECQSQRNLIIQEKRNIKVESNEETPFAIDQK